jgi:hypothetical protein
MDLFDQGLILMTPTLIAPHAVPGSHFVEPTPVSVLVACPDARPPAYEAVVGLAETQQLSQFITGFYYSGHGPISELARQFLPCKFRKLRRQLLRRNDRRIPAFRVKSAASFDLALAIENKVSKPSIRRSVAAYRTEHFDKVVAAEVARTRPDMVFVFSDVGSRHTLPLCKRLGIPTILSMVHGDVREEREILEIESQQSPDYFPLYLGDGQLDRQALDWLHDRRLQDIALADRILVPSDHIAAKLVEYGTPLERIRVIPYAADCHRFQPLANKTHDETCKFLFAGGITQRKGIKYLLQAWKKIRRPHWRLQLLGGLPSRLGPLENDLKEEGIEHLGRVGHAEMPALMAQADVFVFPSLFEGSAVVTYEAMACGLPSVCTAASGTVARDGLEGFLVPSRDVDALADRMDQLGQSPELRAKMALAARKRAEAFDWSRYHDSIQDVILENRS